MMYRALNGSGILFWRAYLMHARTQRPYSHGLPFLNMCVRCVLCLVWWVDRWIASCLSCSWRTPILYCSNLAAYVRNFLSESLAPGAGYLKHGLCIITTPHPMINTCLCWLH